MSVGACRKTIGTNFNCCRDENAEAFQTERVALRGANQGCALVVLGVNSTAARQNEEALL